jgi:hypothetical protein
MNRDEAVSLAQEYMRKRGSDFPVLDAVFCSKDSPDAELYCFTDDDAWYVYFDHLPDNFETTPLVLQVRCRDKPVRRLFQPDE